MPPLSRLRRAETMDIDRCYCYQRTFGELKVIAERTESDSVSELQEHVTFGENCRLCHAYVERMLQTGRTRFDEIVDANSSSGS